MLLGSGEQEGVSRATSPMSVRPCVHKQEQSQSSPCSPRELQNRSSCPRALTQGPLCAWNSRPLQEERTQAQRTNPVSIPCRVMGKSMIFMSKAIEGKDNPCSLSISRKRPMALRWHVWIYPSPQSIGSALCLSSFWPACDHQPWALNPSQALHFHSKQEVISVISVISAEP